MKALFALSLCLFSSCAAAPTPLAYPSDSNRLQATHLPTPFSADEIRDALPDGSQLRFRVEQLLNLPKEFVQVWTFTDPSYDETSFSTQNFNSDGSALTEPSLSRAEWADLQAHASFKSATTTLTTDVHTTPLGDIECWLYTVMPNLEAPNNFTQLWFDPNRPGPPLDYLDIANGVQKYRMTMIADERP